MEIKKKVALHTLGCRLNFSETGSIAQGFAQRSYDIVPFGMQADIVFLNTCTVTDSADSTCRNLIRKAKRNSPEAKIVVAGCYAQMESEKLAAMDEVDLVLGTSEKFNVFEYLDEQEQIIKIDQHNEFWGAATSLEEGEHTRAFLKIQDGCNYICSFCIIPFARGRSRTISIEEAYQQCQDLVSKGFKEIVLTGVNIGEYEATSGEKLSELIEALLKIPVLERLRLSSVEPNTITDELLEVLSSSNKFMPHFHIPLQSGDDQILQKMRRKYSVKEYEAVINKIMKYFPTAAIGADIICGYPGETKAQFENTYNLVEKLPLTHLHVFPYSKRKNTTAAKASDHVAYEIKKQRVHQLINLGGAKIKQLSLSMIGTETKVLIEKQNAKDYLEGHTPNFLKIKILLDSSSDSKNFSSITWTNTIQNIGIIGIDDSGVLLGKMIS